MLDPLYRLVADGIVVFHDLFAHVFGKNSFWSYALALVLLVICVRILIFPLFVKSVKAQRTMQMLQPRIREIKEKYKHDRQLMNVKIMELQKEHGNPLLGCLPILLQIPVFFAIFHVFNRLRPRNGPNGFDYYGTVGLTRDQVQAIAEAKFGGVSLSGALTSSSEVLSKISANGAAVRVTAVVLIIVMSLTTFLTQRQIMSRHGPVDPQQQVIQKVILYVSPVMLAVFGVQFPIAVLIYWMTSNLWSMGQQFFIIRKMPPVGAAAGDAAGTGGGKGGAGGSGGSGPGGGPAGTPRLTQVRQPPAGPGATRGPGGGPGGSVQAPPRRPGGSGSKRRKPRRGGRR